MFPFDERKRKSTSPLDKWGKKESHPKTLKSRRFDEYVCEEKASNLCIKDWVLLCKDATKKMQCY